MKRATHISTGAACALPIAAGLGPAAAAGALLLGMAGAVVPDYADLRSDARRVLRHRGISHSILFATVAVLLVSIILNALAGVDDEQLRLESSLVTPLLAAFALGIGSHLLLDACTPSGIRPLLPFSQLRVRLLPPGVRIRTAGWLDRAIHAVASLVVTLGLVYLVIERLRS